MVTSEDAGLRPPRVAAETAGRTGSAAPVGADGLACAVMAVAVLGAAAVHFGVAPDHFDESRFHGAFFFLAGWAQVTLGLAVLVRPSRAVLRGVLGLNAVLAALWGLSRLVGVPFGDDPWAGEPVEFAGVLATSLEGVAALGAGALLRGGLGRHAVPRRVAVAAVGILAVALVAATTASVAPALTGDHSHRSAVGRGGDAGHQHGGASGAAGLGTATGAAGAANAAGAVGATGAGGHGPGVAGSGIEAGNGTSPCELSGVSIEGNSRHGERGPSVQQAITDPSTRLALAEQITAARDAAARHPTVADATAAGYRRVTAYIPCIGAHYMNFSLVDGTFDPGAPEMLLYDGTEPDARIVGLSYYVAGVTRPPEGFAGPNDEWHQHIGLCVRGTLVVGGSNLTAEECAARGGTKADGSQAWMVHAWVVPGWESAWGVFSGEHPELGVRVAH